MSPFIQMEQMIFNDGNTREEVNDVIYDDIMENIVLVELSLKESNEITDTNVLNKKLEKKLAEERELVTVLNEKTKQLSELNKHSECLQLNYAKHRDQFQFSHQITAVIFNGYKKFNAKVGKKIRQRHVCNGLDVEYRYEDDLVIAKVCKDEKWMELVINENLRFELLNMSPKPNSFDEIKLLFDSTMNIHGLFSIYQWHQ